MREEKKVERKEEMECKKKKGKEKKGRVSQR